MTLCKALEKAALSKSGRRGEMPFFVIMLLRTEKSCAAMMLHSSGYQ